MEKYIGKSVYKGTAIGPINVLKKSDGIVKRQHVEDVAAELQRLEDAKKQAQAQLGALYEKALQEVGEVNAQPRRGLSCLFVHRQLDGQRLRFHRADIAASVHHDTTGLAAGFP